VIAVPSPTGHPAYTETFPRAPQSVAQARRLVRTVLGTWALDELADDAALVVSELTANAVRHARCRRIGVSVSRVAPATVRVAVTDRCRSFPGDAAAEGGLRAVADDERTDGRGLAVVAWLSARWGAEPLPGGKQVWAELESARARCAEVAR
jgi:serine/threonine-protein kinase RsbW